MNITKAYKTDTLRSIKHTLSRFISMVAIVALGTSFFVGFKAAYPDMIDTAEEYYKDYNLMDIRIQSNIGIYENDIYNLEQIQGVAEVQGEKFVDGLLEMLNDDEDPKFEGLVDIDGSQLTIRAYALGDPNQGMNRLRLIDGEWPDEPGECVVTDSRLTTPERFQIGEIIKLTGDGESLDYSLNTTEFTIVGVVESPYYISFERGATTAGSGKLGDYIYIPEETFTENVNYYSEAYIKVEGADEFEPYSKKYDEKVSQVVDVIRQASDGILAISVSDLYQSLPGQIVEGEEKYNKAEAYASEKLGAAYNELQELKAAATDGGAKLQAAEDEINRKYSAALQQINSSNNKYSAELKKYNTLYAQVSRYELLLDSKQAQYDTALSQYNDSKDRLNQANTEITVAKYQIESTKKMIASTQQVSEQLQNNYNASLEDLDLKGMADSVREENPELAAKLDAAAHLTAQGTAADAAVLVGQELVQQQTQLKQAEADLQAAENEYSASKARLDQANAQLVQSKADLNAANSKLTSAKRQLDVYKNKLQDANINIQMGDVKADAEYQAALNQLEAKRAQVELATKNLEAYEQKYADTEASVNRQLLAARAQLDKAQNLLDTLPDAYWNVFTRDDSPGYTGYGSASYNMKSLAVVFPTFFFIVSTLICLVTMTRMVEEERTQLGTLKALGYDNKEIITKYMIYALGASLIGSVLGISVGFVVFPKAFFAAWGIMYDLPSLNIHYIFGYIVIALGIAVVSTCGAAYLACRSELASVPAVLMRPKPPKEGKRVFLENIDFIWSKLNFTSKVTARNLLRNFKRFLMTLLGIGGCTALILAGFGLSDSVGACIDNQYGKGGIAKYDVQVVLKDGATSDSQIVNSINDLPGIEKSMLAELKVCKGSSDRSDNEVEVDILVPEDPSALPEFINLVGKRGKTFELDDSGAIITQKFADKTDTDVGDMVTVSWSEGSKTVSYNVKVSAIVKNYTFHYVYMTPAYYEQVTGTAPTFTYMYSGIKDGMTKADKVQLETDINSFSEVNGSVYTSVVQNNFENIINSLNMVIIVLIIAAAALAFVVLYNLNNINVNERIRELATLKVLGFYDGEVSAYIYRENVILTILGTILGLILGVPLQRIIVSAIDIDAVTFGTTLDFTSFLFSALLTIFFAVIVNLIMHFNLKHIKMVESLKSVE